MGRHKRRPRPDPQRTQTATTVQPVPVADSVPFVQITTTGSGEGSLRQMLGRILGVSPETFTPDYAIPRDCLSVVTMNACVQFRAIIHCDYVKGLTFGQLLKQVSRSW